MAVYLDSVFRWLEVNMSKIIHVDMDAFFVSVEIRDNPSLADKPVAVGGSRVARGVLSTCNYIAREYGVHSAMPTALALRKCPDLILLPGRMDVYKSVSQQIRSIFERYTHLIEPLSLDEAYLDVSECQMFQGSATLIAQDICNTIYRELNLTASAGVAPIKYLAKVASDINKPNGIYTIAPDQVASFIDDMSLKKIPGIGKVTFDKLQKAGLSYGADIKNLDQQYLMQKFGKLGGLLWKRCQGLDERQVSVSRERKSVGVERTFPEDIDQIEVLQTILLEKILPELGKRSERHLAERGISKLGIKLKFDDFQQTTKEHSYRQFDEQIFLSLLDEAFHRAQNRKIRLLGAHIGLSSEPQVVTQLSFEGF
jgi:DNA polymerase-4